MIKTLRLSQLVPHPDNPRLFLRDDVVNAIAEQIKDKGFEERHAPHVRELANGKYQIISGHQRTEAARRAGIATIHCVIVEMTDEEAFRELLLSNAQSDLKPLEIGVFLLRAVATSKGGRKKGGKDGEGNKGGLADYARQMGASRQSYQQYRSAAEVAAKAEKYLAPLIDKAFQLEIIHRCDPEDWLALVERMVAGGWSTDQTERYVSVVKELNLPDDLADIIPRSALLERFFQKQEFSPGSLAKVVAAIRATEEMIRSYVGENPEAPEGIAAFRQWLQAHPVEALDVRAIQKYQRLLAQTLERATEEAERRWNLGDWREHIAELSDNSISLLLSDPPYGIGFRSDRRKTREALDLIANDEDVAKAMDELAQALNALMPKLKDDAHVLVFTHWRVEADARAAISAAGLDIRASLIWVKDQYGLGDLSGFAPMHERIIHATKGKAVLLRREPDVMEAARPTNGDNTHPTEKPVDLLRRLIECTTVEGEIVADPFGGVASTLVAAKESKRRFWGCEIDKAHHAVGAARLAGEK